ncbi:MAG: C45 family peptidase [Phycisphaeraceae bacterium]
MQLDFRVVTDSPSSSQLENIFATYWPAYQKWMQRSSVDDGQHGRLQLHRHMPELIKLYDHLHERFGGTIEVQRFLSMYNPPPVVRACTQLVLSDDTGPILLRSYDHHPNLFDRLVLNSEWSGTSTLAMSDCLWGALDGINEHGLAIALAFGGRQACGDGFSASLICRYVIQTCKTVTEAKSALKRLPVYMPYTFVVVDASGDFITAFMGPDRPARFVARRASANQQGAVEWPAYAQFVESEARLRCAESLLESTQTIDSARRAFLVPPVWRGNYAKASGTLYVAEYSAATRSLRLHWPTQAEQFSISNTRDRYFSVQLAD